MYHIISITMRRKPGDRAYHIRESFAAASLTEACGRHNDYPTSAARSTVLRDGATGERFSREQTKNIARAAAWRRRLLKARGKARLAARRDLLAETCKSNLKSFGPGWIMPMWPLYLIAMRRGWSRDRWYSFAERAANSCAAAAKATGAAL